MIDIGIMFYTDTTISNNTIADIRYIIKKPILSYIDFMTYMYDSIYDKNEILKGCNRINKYVASTNNGSNITSYIDGHNNSNNIEMMNLITSFTDEIVPISLNDLLLPKDISDIDRTKRIIEAMEKCVFRHIHPLVIYVRNSDIQRGSADHVIDGYIKRCTERYIFEYCNGNDNCELTRMVMFIEVIVDKKSLNTDVHMYGYSHERDRQHPILALNLCDIIGDYSIIDLGDKQFSILEEKETVYD